MGEIELYVFWDKNLHSIIGEYFAHYMQVGFSRGQCAELIKELLEISAGHYCPLRYAGLGADILEGMRDMPGKETNIPFFGMKALVAEKDGKFSFQDGDEFILMLMDMRRYAMPGRGGDFKNVVVSRRGFGGEPGDHRMAQYIEFFTLA